MNCPFCPTPHRCVFSFDTILWKTLLHAVPLHIGRLEWPPATAILLRLQVVAVAATFCEVWAAVAVLVAELDVLAGFADLATADPTRPYCKPEILDKDAGEIVLKVRG